MENGLPFCVAEGTLQCPCLENFNGTFCDECANGYFGFPDCNRKFWKYIFLLLYLFNLFERINFAHVISQCVQFVIVLSTDRNLGRADELTGQI